ncbi:MAG: hypothetical protein IJJ94_08940 [Bacteroidaceae bacterium]|nr:hypothetical protein [Bacteroidaceae bacterium]
MKKLVCALIVALTASSCFLSCKSNDDEVEYSSDCYIKSFALGGMKRMMHSTTTSGNDTTYYITLTGSAFPMSINHIEGTITNATPLPTGTQLDAITTTITSQGLVVYASEADTTTWTRHASTDSLNFTQPLIFRVIATDGHSYRDYKVSLSTRDNDPDEYAWTKLTTADALEGRTATKLLPDATNGEATSLPVILSSDAGSCYVSRATGSQWNEQPCTGLPQTADVRSAVTFDNAFWMTTTDGQLYTSDDAIAWSQVSTDVLGAATLIAASSTALYASILSAQGLTIARSADGINWQSTPTERALDAEVVASAAYTQPNGNHRVVIATAAQGATALDTWSLLEDYETTWSLFSDDELNTYRLPLAKVTSITHYNDRLFAFSGTDILVSDDNGITWQTDSKISLPFSDTDVQSATAMGEYIYILGGTQLWQARLNSYGE